MAASTPARQDPADAPPVARPAQVSQLRFAGAGTAGDPWFDVTLSPAPEDRPAFAALQTDAAGAAAKEAGRVREAFLAGPEMAAVAAAEERLAGNAAAVAAAEADLARATAEWSDLFRFAATGRGPKPEVRKELEARIRELEGRVTWLKAELPDAIRQEVRAARAEAAEKFRAAVRAALAGLEEGYRERERATRARLAAAVMPAFAEWMAATYALDGLAAARSDPRLARLN